MCPVYITSNVEGAAGVHKDFSGGGEVYVGKWLLVSCNETGFPCLPNYAPRDVGEEHLEKTCGLCPPRCDVRGRCLLDGGCSVLARVPAGLSKVLRRTKTVRDCSSHGVRQFLGFFPWNIH